MPEERKERRNPRYVPIATVSLMIIGIAAVLFIATNLISGVSFSSFKSTFNSAQRVAIVATSSNATQLNLESTCFTTIIEIISGRRSPSTIDFFAISNNSCTYAPNGLGRVLNPVTTNATSCLRSANSEPGIFLNYSALNRTVITPSHLYIYANSAYLSRCPIAVDLS